MTLTDSSRQQLLGISSDAGGCDLIRGGVRMISRDLIEVEAAEVIGAARYECSPERHTERNGYRLPLLATQADDIDQQIPKLPRGQFFANGAGTPPGVWMPGCNMGF